MTDTLARYVVCAIGNFTSFDGIDDAIRRVAGPGFERDAEYSELEPDSRMPGSFAVSADRVSPSFGPADEAAVEKHSAVAYVLSPPVQPAEGIAIGARVLSLIKALFEVGAVAVKIESSGIAHGRTRWIELANAASRATAAKDAAGLALALYTAFVRRPIHDDDDGVYYTCGMQLLGRRDVETSEDLPDRAAVEILDRAAALALAAPWDSDLEGHELESTDFGECEIVDGGDCERYEEDDFSFNPHGYWGVVPAGDDDEEEDDDD